MQKKHAFTLIEMLVVLAIMAILSSMIFPSLSRAREGGRRASCQNNLRQIGMAVSMYTDDYDEHYVKMENTIPLETPPPVPSGCNEVVDVPVSWAYPLLPYVQSNALFNCPSLGEPATHVGDGFRLIKLWDDCTYPPAGPGGIGGGGGGGGGGVVTNCPMPKPPPLPLPAYGFNTMINHESAWIHTEDLKIGQGFSQSRIVEDKCAVPPSAPNTTKGKLLHPEGVMAVAVRKPSETIMIVDIENNKGKAASGANITDDIHLDYPLINTTEAEMEDVPLRLSKRHLGGYNALFADGHVKFLPYGTSKPQMWSVEDD